MGNPALALQVARTKGTPLKLRKKMREKFENGLHL
jgi:hypothetical protein